MLRTVKPKNARSKRAMEAREPKEVEDARTVIFVRGTHTGEVLNGVMKDLMALKRPHAISFAKKNEIRPFEDSASLDFWSTKNDASMFVIGQSSKKRPNNLVFARMYDYRVLDMLEVGVTSFVPMSDIKTPKCTPGHRPLVHFASELFDTHPRFIHLKSMLLDFFNGDPMDTICLTGLEYVVSVTVGPTPSNLNLESEDTDSLPPIHIRTYTIRMLASGVRTPRTELTPMGPSIDLVLRRHQPPDPEMLKQALKQPKLKQGDIESGLGKRKKNIEIDEMGDVRARIHLGKQDLSKLQTRKMKGLKRRKGESEDEADDDDDESTNDQE